MTSMAHMLTQRKHVGVLHKLFIHTWHLSSLVKQNGVLGDLWGPNCELFLNICMEHNTQKLRQMQENVAAINIIQ